MTKARKGFEMPFFMPNTTSRLRMGEPMAGRAKVNGQYLLSLA
jgi:hypothetical protein